jgi:hypothetical protein
MNPQQQYAFEKLRVWQAARDLAKRVYVARANFPQRDLYGLTSQCNRAVVSVAANLAKDVGVLAGSLEADLRDGIEHVSAQLNALHRSQRARII